MRNQKVKCGENMPPLIVGSEFLLQSNSKIFLFLSYLIGFYKRMTKDITIVIVVYSFYLMLVKS